MPIESWNASACVRARVETHKADAKNGEQKRYGEHEKQKHVAMYRHKKDSTHDEQDYAEFAEGENAIGDHLTDHQAERGYRGHGELFEGAAFAFAYQAERDHQNRHDLAAESQ